MATTAVILPVETEPQESEVEAWQSALSEVTSVLRSEFNLLREESRLREETAQRQLSEQSQLIQSLTSQITAANLVLMERLNTPTPQPSEPVAVILETPPADEGESQAAETSLEEEPKPAPSRKRRTL